MKTVFHRKLAVTSAKRDGHRTNIELCTIMVEFIFVFWSIRETSLISSAYDSILVLLKFINVHPEVHCIGKKSPALASASDYYGIPRVITTALLAWEGL